MVRGARVRHNGRGVLCYGKATRLPREQSRRNSEFCLLFRRDLVEMHQ